MYSLNPDEYVTGEPEEFLSAAIDGISADPMLSCSIDGFYVKFPSEICSKKESLLHEWQSLMAFVRDAAAGQKDTYISLYSTYLRPFRLDGFDRERLARIERTAEDEDAEMSGDDYFYYMDSHAAKHQEAAERLGRPLRARWVVEDVCRIYRQLKDGTAFDSDDAFRAAKIRLAANLLINRCGISVRAPYMTAEEYSAYGCGFE